MRGPPIAEETISEPRQFRPAHHSGVVLSDAPALKSGGVFECRTGIKMGHVALDFTLIDGTILERDPLDEEELNDLFENLADAFDARKVGSRYVRFSTAQPVSKAGHECHDAFRNFSVKDQVNFHRQEDIDNYPMLDVMNTEADVMKENFEAGRLEKNIGERFHCAVDMWRSIQKEASVRVLAVVVDGCSEIPEFSANLIHDLADNNVNILILLRDTQVPNECLDKSEHLMKRLEDGEALMTQGNVPLWIAIMESGVQVKEAVLTAVEDFVCPSV